MKKGACVSIQDWGAIGEVLGAIAVVLTLGYLATQIRYAWAVATDASRQARLAGVVEMMQVTISNRDYRQAWTKAADPEYEARLTDLGERLGGTPDEADLVWSGCCAWAYIHWNQYRSMKSDADRRELESTVASFYSRAPLSIVWQHDPLLRTMVDPEFITWVDAVLARPREA